MRIRDSRNSRTAVNHHHFGLFEHANIRVFDYMMIRHDVMRIVNTKLPESYQPIILINFKKKLRNIFRDFFFLAMDFTTTNSQLSLEWSLLFMVVAKCLI